MNRTSDMAPRLCPRDSTPLMLCPLENASYWWCERCEGLLVDQFQVAQLKTRALLGLSPPRSAPRLAPGQISEGTVWCSCSPSRLMATVTTNQLTVDTCENCGTTWLDGGEVGRFLAPTGISRSVDSKRGTGIPEPWPMELLLFIIEVLGA